MRDYIVYNADVAKKLIEKGFELKTIKANRNNPKLNVYFFQDEEGLHKEVRKLVDNKK